MSNSDGFFFAVGATILAMFGVGVALNKERQLNRLSKKVGSVVDDLVHADQLDIRESMVKKAVDEAVSREMSSRLYEISRDILGTAKANLKQSVNKVVSDEVDNVKKSVADQIYGKIHSVDISNVVDDVRDDVKEKLEDLINDKLDDVADDIVSDYTDRHRVVVIRK